MTENRNATPMDKRLQQFLEKSYATEKAFEKIAQIVDEKVRTKIAGLMLGLSEVKQVLLAAQALEQKKRRWHLYRAAREEYYQEIDPHESLPAFVPFSRRKRRIP